MWLLISLCGFTPGTKAGGTSRPSVRGLTVNGSMAQPASSRISP